MQGGLGENFFNESLGGGDISSSYKNLENILFSEQGDCLNFVEEGYQDQSLQKNNQSMDEFSDLFKSYQS